MGNVNALRKRYEFGGTDTAAFLSARFDMDGFRTRKGEPLTFFELAELHHVRYLLYSIDNGLIPLGKITDRGWLGARPLGENSFSPRYFNCTGLDQASARYSSCARVPVGT